MKNFNLLRFSWTDGSESLIYGESKENIYADKQLYGKQFYNLVILEEVYELPLNERFICDEEGYPLPNEEFVIQLRNAGFFDVGKTYEVKIGTGRFEMKLIKIDDLRLYYEPIIYTAISSFK